MEPIVKCKTCGKDIPQREILKHYKIEHPDSQQKAKDVAPPPETKKVEPPLSVTPSREPGAPTEAELALKEKAKQEAEAAHKAKEVEAKAKEEAEPPKEKPKGEKEVEITTPQASSTGILRYTITLPADAFVLFNLAKSFGLEKDIEKLFDEWVWDCIRMRYKTDYKMRLVLAPEEK